MEKIALTEIDFAALVNGEMVERGGVQIILQDIGFELMERAIRAAKTTRSF
jgi:hypothetical protein